MVGKIISKYFLDCFDVKLSIKINSDESNGGFIWENCSSYILFQTFVGKKPNVCISLQNNTYKTFEELRMNLNEF